VTHPSAVVFDMDGILIETEPIWDKVRRRMAAEDGLSWPESSTPIMMGLSTQEWAEHMTDVVGFSGTWEEVAQRTIDGVAGEYAGGGLPVLPGAVEAVRRMAGLVPTAIASSSPRRLIDLVVGRLDLADVLTVTVSTEEVPRGKPYPDGYLRACELLGVDAARAVAVEDSTNGVLSAFAAGMKVVCVPPGFHPPFEDTLALCAAVLDSLDDLTEELLHSFAA
jgi:beta-phosphoglucomutase-like phosphatase (HAD superfamily)